jgi:hypothetical protein
MDRMTSQICELSEAERFQLLLRLSREVPNSTFQQNVSAVRGRRGTHRDIPVTGYGLNGAEPATV